MKLSQKIHIENKAFRIENTGKKANVSLGICKYLIYIYTSIFWANLLENGSKTSDQASIAN